MAYPRDKYEITDPESRESLFDVANLGEFAAGDQDKDALNLHQKDNQEDAQYGRDALGEDDYL